MKEAPRLSGSRRIRARQVEFRFPDCPGHQGCWIVPGTRASRPMEDGVANWTNEGARRPDETSAFPGGSGLDSLRLGFTGIEVPLNRER